MEVLVTVNASSVRAEFPVRVYWADSVSSKANANELALLSDVEFLSETDQPDASVVDAAGKSVLTLVDRLELLLLVRTDFGPRAWAWFNKGQEVCVVEFAGDRALRAIQAPQDWFDGVDATRRGRRRLPLVWPTKWDEPDALAGLLPTSPILG
jgi:hypothetical protein